MTQNCKVVFGNISKKNTLERVFDSKNQALMWLNHQLVRECGLKSVHELYFRIESYDPNKPKVEDFQVSDLPF